MKALKLIAVILLASLSANAQSNPDIQSALDINTFNGKVISKAFEKIMPLIESCNQAATEEERQYKLREGIEQLGQEAVNAIKDEENKRFAKGLLEEAKKYPETFFVAQKAFLENALHVYPNPSDGSNVTVEFYTHNWQFHFEPMKVGNADLQLFYNGRKIADLNYNNIQNNKVIIDSKYLTQAGTYTIHHNGVSTNFIVKK